MKLFKLFPIQSCNLNCYYCPMKQWIYPKDSERNTLTLETTTKYLDEYCPSKEWLIHISGGEPSLCDWLDELINWLTEKGYYGIIETNGILPIKHSSNFKRISAWHLSMGIKNPPKYYDKILIIKNPKDCWQDKVQYCIDNNIDYQDVHFYEFHLPEHLRTPNKGLRCKNQIIRYCTFAYSDGTMQSCPIGIPIDINGEKMKMQDMIPPPMKNVNRDCPYCGNIGGFEMFLHDEWVEIFNSLK